MMRAILAIAIYCLCAASHAFAQTGSAKTQTQLNAEIGANYCAVPGCLYPDNAVGQNTPFGLRQGLLDIVASFPPGLTNLTGDCTSTNLGVITCTKTNGTLFGTMATQNANSIMVTGGAISGAAISGGTITGLPAPVNTSDAATKQYVDNSAVGLTPHAQAVLATAAALPTNTYNNGSSGVGATLTATVNAALTVDGTAVSSGQRIVVKNEATAANNGIYTVTNTGSGSAAYVLTRATDANSPGASNPNAIGFGTYVFVTSGSANINTGWSVNSNVTTIGGSAINWAQFSSFNTISTDNTYVCSTSSIISFCSPELKALQGALTTAFGSIYRSAAGVYEMVFGPVNVVNYAALTANTIPFPTLHLQGYYTAGDGGGGDLEESASCTPNNIITYNDSAGHCYTRTVKTPINILWAGADPTDVSDSYPAINDCITYVQSTYLAGGSCYIPPGLFHISTGLIVPSGVFLFGDGFNGTGIEAWHTDIQAIEFTGGGLGSGNNRGMRGVTVFCKGTNADPTTFGASNPCVYDNAIGTILTEVQILGGLVTLQVGPLMGDGYYAYTVIVGANYGQENILDQGAQPKMISNKWDWGATGVNPTNSMPYPNWAASTNYAVGNVVVDGGYLIQVSSCTSSCTSGTSLPTLKNYGVPISDHQVMWTLYQPSTYYDVYFQGSQFLENHLIDTDLSGPFTASALIDNTGGITLFHSDIFAGPLIVNHNEFTLLEGSEVGGGVNIQPGVSSFILTGNGCLGGTMRVNSGASDHYNIIDNIGCSVIDSGTGTHKLVTGNN